jgi:hypothetical protein
MKIDDLTLIQDYAKEKAFNYLGSVFYDWDLEDAIGFPDKLTNSSFMKDLKKVYEKII